MDAPTMTSDLQSLAENPKAPETRPAVTQGRSGTQSHPEKGGHAWAMLGAVVAGQMLLICCWAWSTWHFLTAARELQTVVVKSCDLRADIEAFRERASAAPE